jgi:hypothetical protein
MSIVQPTVIAGSTNHSKKVDRPEAVGGPGAALDDGNGIKSAMMMCHSGRTKARWWT